MQPGDQVRRVSRLREDGGFRSRGDRPLRRRIEGARRGTTGRGTLRRAQDLCLRRSAVRCDLTRNEDAAAQACRAQDASPDSGRTFALLEGADKNKDQSYFLALLSQAQLRDARFPIGHLQKPELRAIAADHRLVTAGKKDSQGICFIGEVKMQDFLRAYVPDAPGPIVRATDGKEMGRHRGLHYYTNGQRKGIGIPSNTDFKAYVVVGKRAADNALLVAFDTPDAPGLFVPEIRVMALSWIGKPVTEDRAMEGRVRYRDPRVPLDFSPRPDGTATIRFRSPQRALAPGQILALYEGEQLLGGGVYV